VACCSNQNKKNIIQLYASEYRVYILYASAGETSTHNELTRKTRRIQIKRLVENFCSGEYMKIILFNIIEIILFNNFRKLQPKRIDQCILSLF
jgi:hypothetical protein